MPGWRDNPIMTWNGIKVTDHGRASLSVDVERIGNDRRMADGTLRRQFIALKRTWSTSWENLPSTNSVSGGFKTADGGMSGEQIEAFMKNTPGAFRMVLRRGSAINKTVPNVTESQLPYEDDDFYIANVMITDFSKEVEKRGKVDIWSASITLEEV